MLYMLRAAVGGASGAPSTPNTRWCCVWFRYLPSYFSGTRLRSRCHRPDWLGSPALWSLHPGQEREIIPFSLSGQSHADGHELLPKMRDALTGGGRTKCPRSGQCGVDQWNPHQEWCTEHKSHCYYWENVLTKLGALNSQKAANQTGSTQF